MRRILVSIELDGDSPLRRERSVALWLERHVGVQVMAAQWYVLTSLSVEEIRQEIQTLLDPADRLLVTQVHGKMSYCNAIENERFGAA